MNQILQYIAIAAVAGIAFTTLYSNMAESLSFETISQHDKTEILKNQASESIKLIEILDSPLRIDLVNNGIDTIVIKKLFINGVVDDSYLIDGTNSTDILKDKVVRITPNLTGSKISILTENYKSFEFGS